MTAGCVCVNSALRIPFDTDLQANVKYISRGNCAVVMVADQQNIRMKTIKFECTPVTISTATSSAAISDITMIFKSQPICVSPFLCCISQKCISLFLGFLFFSFQCFNIKVVCLSTDPRLKLIQPLQGDPVDRLTLSMTCGQM